MIGIKGRQLVRSKRSASEGFLGPRGFFSVHTYMHLAASKDQDCIRRLQPWQTPGTEDSLGTVSATRHPHWLCVDAHLCTRE